MQNNPETWHKNFWPQVIKQLGKNYDLIWLLLVWVAFTGKRKTVIICLLSLLITLAAITAVKETVRRTRPRDVIKAQTATEDKKAVSRSWSFPSGDTASVFSAGTVLAFAVPWPVTIGFAGCCCGVGFLRVVELAHYPSDVLAGAALGILCGWIAIKIAQKKPQIENILGGLERKISIIGVIIIPIIMWKFQGLDNFKIMLKFYFPAAIVMLLIGRWLMNRQPVR
jgi:membrane-associated phospholipid phosphatase